MPPPRNRPCLIIVLGSLGWITAHAQTAPPATSIIAWRHEDVNLYATPASPPETHRRESLPPEVDITEFRNPFYRFTDPRTHVAWYVLKADVKTNAITEAAPPADNANQTCSQYGPQGMAQGCQPN